MYNLVLEPARKPVSYNDAMRELYDYARHRHLIVRPDGTADGAYHFALLSQLDRRVVQRATVSAVLEGAA